MIDKQKKELKIACHRCNKDNAVKQSVDGNWYCQACLKAKNKGKINGR